MVGCCSPRCIACPLHAQMSASSPSIYLIPATGATPGGSTPSASTAAVPAAAAAGSGAAAAGHSSAFWLRVQSVTLRPGQQRKIPVVFSPMSPGPHRCAIVAMERGRRSEVVWEIAGTADMPVPSARLAERVPSAAGPVTLLLRIPPLNAQREGAAEAVLDARVR